MIPQEFDWYGIKIKERILIRENKIMIGDYEIILLTGDLKKIFSLMEFFIVTKYFLKEKSKLILVFGLFSNSFERLTRKKLKENFISNFNHRDFISFLESDNKEAYYVNLTNTEEFIGLELRFNEKTELLFDTKNIKEYLLKEIRDEKKKHLNLIE